MNGRKSIRLICWIGFFLSAPLGYSSSGVLKSFFNRESPSGPLSSADLKVEGPIRSEEVQNWCKTLDATVTQLHWKISPCGEIQWKVGGHSVDGRPLVYAEFGEADAENTTLIFSTVHGDEITPFYLAIQLAHWLGERKGQLTKTKVVIAPLVNPDGFLAKPKTRMNARGVDINRNFSTQDWENRALLAWKTKYKSDKRRFPGLQSNSEPETLFQVELIQKIRPQKVLSIHSPLNFLDYDGPSSLTLSQFPTSYAQECDKLKKRVKAISSGFFPGSLGNYAGRELGIPTLTLELPSADPRRAEQYWKKFSDGIRTMIQFSVPKYAAGALDRSDG